MQSYILEGISFLICSFFKHLYIVFQALIDDILVAVMHVMSQALHLRLWKRVTPRSML